MSRRVSVAIHLVDGSLWEQDHGQELLKRLAMLEASGLSGKALIDQLLGDDWGAPPEHVNISGRDVDGRLIERVIGYD
jgi:hypothetical protein